MCNVQYVESRVSVSTGNRVVTSTGNRVVTSTGNTNRDKQVQVTE